MSRMVSTIAWSMVSSLAATRFLVSLVVLLVTLIYAVLTQGRLVPHYADLAARMGMPSLFLLLILYLMALGLCGLIWYLWILHPVDSLNTQLMWRGVYRQTDRTGVWWQSLLLLAGVAGGLFLALPVVENYHREVAIYLAVVLGLPIALDLFPSRRPRRIIASPDDRSAFAIADRLAARGELRDNVLSSLAIYNELDPQDPDLAGLDLPEGIVIEVPPKF